MPGYRYIFSPGINHQIPYIQKIWMKAARFSTSLHYLPPYVIVSCHVWITLSPLSVEWSVVSNFWRMIYRLHFSRSKDQSIGSESNDTISKNLKLKVHWQINAKRKEKKKSERKRTDNALCPCFFGRSACRVLSAYFLIILASQLRNFCQALAMDNKKDTKKRESVLFEKFDTEADIVVDCCRDWGEGHKQRHGQCANDRH